MLLLSHQFHKNLCDVAKVIGRFISETVFKLKYYLSCIPLADLGRLFKSIWDFKQH